MDKPSSVFSRKPRYTKPDLSGTASCLARARTTTGGTVHPWQDAVISPIGTIWRRLHEPLDSGGWQRSRVTMYCPVNELDGAENRSAAAAGLLVEATPAAGSDTSGDAARDALFAEFQPLVQRLMRQYADNAELRQDLPGEIYHRFCCLYEAYDPSRGIPLRPYMVRMLTASVYNFMRSNWRHQNRELQLLPEVGEDPAYAGEDGTPEWIQSLWMQETLAQLPTVIAQLPARQQQVVIWRYYHALSFEEIADKLHVRPATVRSLLRHAINHLRRKLTSEADSG